MYSWTEWLAYSNGDLTWGHCLTPLKSISVGPSGQCGTKLTSSPRGWSDMDRPLRTVQGRPGRSWEQSDEPLVPKILWAETIEVFCIRVHKKYFRIAKLIAVCNPHCHGDIVEFKPGGWGQRGWAGFGADGERCSHCSNFPAYLTVQNACKETEAEQQVKFFLCLFVTVTGALCKPHRVLPGPVGMVSEQGCGSATSFPAMLHTFGRRCCDSLPCRTCPDLTPCLIAGLSLPPAAVHQSPHAWACSAPPPFCSAAASPPSPCPLLEDPECPGQLELFPPRLLLFTDSQH